MRDNRGLISRLLIAALLLPAVPATPQRFDVVVYGATSGGVMAALAAKREGASVAVVEPGRFVGGLTAGGWSTVGSADQKLAAGLAREFYERVGRRYGKPVAWAFEPHAALAVFRGMLREAGIAVYREEPLREEGGVKKRKRKLRWLITENGRVFRGEVFIDATYEGDLLAHTGLRYEKGAPEEPAAADLTFGLCLASSPTNQIPYPKPLHYDRNAFAAASEGPQEVEGWFLAAELPAGKLSLRFRSGVPGLPAASGWIYAEADYRRRAEFYQMRIDHVAGLLYFLAHDRAAPKPVRERLAAYGLCADEFVYTNGWPHQIYLAEGRRLAASAGEHRVEDAARPFPVPYGSLTPREKDLKNLLVALSPAADPGAWAALRRETISMMIGEAVGVAAAMAARAGVPVQQVDRKALAARLPRAGDGSSIVY